MAAINEEIKKIKDQIEVLRVKIDGANEARRGQGVRPFFFFSYFVVGSTGCCFYLQIASLVLHQFRVSDT